jgi:Uncharacterized protein conserved in bacteria
MSRRVSNRNPSSKASGRLARRGLEAVYVILLLLAAAIGGPGAMAGMPKLVDLVVPSAVLTAEARAPWNDPRFKDMVSLPVIRVPSVMPLSLRASADDADTMAALDAPAAEAVAAATPVIPLAPAHKTMPVIAIVIDDMGWDAVENRRAIALPKEVSLSFLPMPADTPRLVREAHAAGHEVLVHVPMEAQRDRDGSLKNGLWRNLPVEENLRRLEWSLSRVEGYAGINNHEGSVFTSDRAALVPVAEALYGRGIFFLDSRTSPVSQVVPVARAFGVPSADRDVFLDDDQASPAVAKQLKELERVAREQGVAIAIGHPHHVTLDQVTRWCANLKGFRLVPVSTAIRMKTALDLGVQVAASQ